MAGLGGLGTLGGLGLGGGNIGGLGLSGLGARLRVLAWDDPGSFVGGGGAKKEFLYFIAHYFRK